MAGMGDHDDRNAQLNTGAREKLRTVVFLEEAHHLASNTRQGENVVDVFIRQCRELGIGVVTIDQSVSKISSSAVQNTGTSICLSQASPADERTCMGITGIGRRGAFGRLDVGEGIVKLRARRGYAAPFLVKFDLSGVKKGSITDEALIGTPQVRPEPPPAAIRPRGYRGAAKAPSGLSGAARTLLKDVQEYPAATVRQRYRRLGLSPHSGTRLKKTMVEAGHLEEQIVPFGTTRVSALKVGSRPSRRESPQHYFYRHWWASKLAEAGYEVRMEAPRTGGRVDILGSRDGIKLAIEVETGKSNYMANLIACLLSGFDKVVIAATNQEARAAIASELHSSGLGRSSRVHLVGPADAPRMANSGDLF